MENEWADEGVLMALLMGFSEKLVAWNMDVFGNIFRRKKRVRNRLEGVMKVMDEVPTMGLFKLERRLKKEWTEVLLQEEMLWMQKSRVDWLWFGNCNIKYFHTMMLVRRKRNMMEMHKNKEGLWV